MGFLTRDELFADHPPLLTADLEIVGLGTIKIKALSAESLYETAREEVTALATTADDGDLTKFMAKVIVQCMVEPQLQPSDEAKLVKGFEAGILHTIYTAIVDLSSLTHEGLLDIVKKPASLTRSPLPLLIATDSESSSDNGTSPPLPDDLDLGISSAGEATSPQ